MIDIDDLVKLEKVLACCEFYKNATLLRDTAKELHDQRRRLGEAVEALRAAERELVELGHEDKAWPVNVAVRKIQGERIDGLLPAPAPATGAARYWCNDDSIYKDMNGVLFSFGNGKWTCIGKTSRIAPDSFCDPLDADTDEKAIRAAEKMRKEGGR